MQDSATSDRSSPALVVIDSGIYAHAPRKSVLIVGPACESTKPQDCAFEEATLAVATPTGGLLVASMHGGARLLGDDAQYLGPIGSFGHGADQYETVLATGVSGDGEFVLYDIVRSRVLVFDTLRRFRTAWQVSTPEDFDGAAIGSSGLFVFTRPAGKRVGDTVLAEARLIRGGDSGTVVRAQVPVAAASTGTRFRPLPNFFEPRTRWAVCPDGRVIVSTGTTLNVHVFSPDGRLKSLIRGGWRGRAVTPQDVGVERVRRFGGQGASAALQAVGDTLARKAPRLHPAITEIGCFGEAFVARETPMASGDSVRWNVMRDDGLVQGHFILPSADRILAASHGRLILLTHPSKDVWRLMRGSVDGVR